MQLEGQETKKQKQQKEIALPQGEEPDFGGPFTQVPRTHALRPVRRASARVWTSLTPPHTRLEKVERTSIFKYDYLHFNKQGGTKEFPHPPLAHMNGPLRFIRNFTIDYWVKPI
jgi:hypothetical protein